MSLTAPVSQGSFHYSNGDIYVESSGANRHRRATLPELRDLFHPPRNSNLPVRDPPAHWYEAQLVHYGLPVSKTKGTAVKRLLDAVNSGSLAVPQTILKIEKNLKKEWDANEKKARKEAKEAVAGQDRKANKSQGIKRKAEDTQNVSLVNVNGMNFNFNFDMAGMSMPTAESASATKSVSKKAKTEPKPSNKTRGREVIPLQTARRTGPLANPRMDSRVKAEPKLKAESKLKAEPKSKAEPRAKREPAVKTEKRVKTENEHASTPRRPKTGPRYDDSPLQTSSPRRPLGLINGTYKISCPYVTEQWGCENLEIVLAIDSPRVWGAYDFEGFSGVFLVPDRPLYGSDERLPLLWRGREHGEGEMTTGDDNHGWISFLGGGQIHGCLEIMGDFDFQGYKVDDDTRKPGSIRSEWESYNEEAYEYERVNRWG